MKHIAQHILSGLALSLALAPMTLPTLNTVAQEAPSITINFTNNMSNVPVNTVSDGSVALCINGTQSVPATAVGATTSFETAPGPIEILYTSLIRSSLDGSLIDPCEAILTLSIGGIDAELPAGNEYDIDISGSSTYVDPRETNEIITGITTNFDFSDLINPEWSLNLIYPDNSFGSNGLTMTTALTDSRTLCLQDQTGVIFTAIGQNDIGSTIRFGLSNVLTQNNGNTTTFENLISNGEVVLTAFYPDLQNGCANVTPGSVLITLANDEVTNVLFDSIVRINPPQTVITFTEIINPPAEEENNNPNEPVEPLEPTEPTEPTEPLEPNIPAVTPILTPITVAAPAPVVSAVQVQSTSTGTSQLPQIQANSITPVAKPTTSASSSLVRSGGSSSQISLIITTLFFGTSMVYVIFKSLQVTEETDELQTL